MPRHFRVRRYTKCMLPRVLPPNPRVDTEQLDSSLLRALVMNAADGIITIDARGIVEMFNPTAERLFGYRAAEVIGHNVKVLMPEPYRSEHDDYLRRYLETGQKRIIGLGREVQGRRKDGSTFPMYLSVAEVEWGERRMFAGIVHDLSERKRSEERLRREKDRAQRYLDIAGAMIVAIGADERVSLINRRGCEIIGASAQVIVGRNWFEGFVPQPLRQQARATFARLVRGENEGVEYAEHAILTAGGEERIIAWHNVALRDDDGKLSGTLSSGEDVTERKRAVAETQRMRAYLKNIIDSMPSILVGVDLEGRITEWNQGAEQSTGLAPASALGRSFAEVLPQLSSQMQSVWEAIRRRQAVRTERVPDERNGEVRYSDVVVYPLIANGAAGAVIRVDDVTNRVRIEQMMVQTEKMMSVGGLAAGMAHEINNPLSAIMQGCQNVLRRLSADLPMNRDVAQAAGVDLDKVGAYLAQRGIPQFLEGIREAAARATQIVTDMLAFSRRSDAKFAPASVEEMLDTAARLVASDYDLKKKYDFRHIEIVRDYDPAVGEIWCDRREIEQVLLNLMKNAAQAMAGSAAPLPHRMTLRTRRESDHVRVEVEDNGPGMDERTRSRVFEPFFTTKPAGVGTGLGLSVSYFIVTERHGGSISVSSTAGQGSCFTLRLPVRGRPAS
jgi:PAS domain S-box-containing protein